MATSSDGPAGAGVGRAELEVDGVAMVRLLGPHDRLLRTLEQQYPDLDVHVRGNQITLGGTPADVTAASQLVRELVTMIQNGHDLGEVEVASSARILEQGAGSPADVLSQAILTSRGKSIRHIALGDVCVEHADVVEDGSGHEHGVLRHVAHD